MTVDYNLDFSENEVEAKKALSDPSSRHYAHQKPPKHDLFEFLPYKTASLQEWGEHLSNVVKHIYIAIKSGDPMGTVPVTAEELKDAMRGNISKTTSLPIDVNYFGIKPSRDEEEEDPKALALPVGNVEEPAIVSLVHWTNELLRILEARDFVPVQLRAALMKTYYAVIFSRGLDSSLERFVEVLEVLKQGFEAELLGSGLILPWKPLLREFDAQYARYTCTKHDPDDCGPFTEDLLQNISRVASDFFDPQDTEEIVQRVLTGYSYLNPTCALPLTIPVHFEPVSESEGQPVYHRNDSRRYLSVFFNLRKQHSKNSVYVTTFCCKVVMESLEAFAKDPKVAHWGEYGILTQQQFNSLLSALSSAAAEMESNLLPEICGAIMYSLTSSNIEHVCRFINVLHSDAQSNGVASGIFEHLCRNLADRVAAERGNSEVDLSGLPESIKLDNDDVSYIVAKLLPVVLLGSTQQGGLGGHHVEGLAALAEICPEQVLDGFLVEIYNSIECVGSSPMLVVPLAEQLFSMLPFLVARPVYRVHVVWLLTLLSKHAEDMFGLESLFEAVIRLAYLVPFHDLSGHGGIISLEFTNNHVNFLEKRLTDSGAVFDSSGEAEALKSATSQFPLLVRSLLEKALTLADSEEYFTLPFVPFVSALCNSASDEIIREVQDLIYTHVTTSGCLSAPQIAQAVSPLVTRDPTLFGRYFEFLDAEIRKEVLNGEQTGAQGKETEDTEDDLGMKKWGHAVLDSLNVSQTESHTSGFMDEPHKVPEFTRLNSCLHILQGAVAGAPSEILKFSDELNNLIHILHTKVGQKCPLVSSIQRAVLRSLSSVRVLNAGLVSDASVQSWDVSNFESPNAENLELNWHIPQQSHVDCALQMIELHVSHALAEIESLMATSERDKPELCADAAIYLRVIADGFSGVSELIDPRFRLSLKTPVKSVSELCKSSVLTDIAPVRLHAFRAMVIQLLHRFLSKSVTKLSGDVLLEFARCLKMCLRNVGREVVDPSEVFETIRSRVDDLESADFPMTRSVLSFRIQELHSKLLALSSCGRIATDLDLIMLRDLLKILCSSDGLRASLEIRETLSDCFASIFGASSVTHDVLASWKMHQEMGIKYSKLLSDQNVAPVAFRSDMNLEALDLLAQTLKIQKKNISLEEDPTIGFFFALSECVAFPSYMYLIDDNLVDAIRPATAPSEIEALRAAKKAKHITIRDNLAALQNKIIEHSEIFRYFRGWSPIYQLLGSMKGCLDNESLLRFMAEGLYRDENLGVQMPTSNEDGHRALLILMFFFDKIHFEARYGYDLAQMYEGGDNYNSMELVITDDFASKLEASPPEFFIDSEGFGPSFFLPEKLTVGKVSRPPPPEYSGSHKKLLCELGNVFTKATVCERFGEGFPTFLFYTDERRRIARMISSLALMGLAPLSVSDYLSVAQDLLDSSNYSGQTQMHVSDMYTGMLLCYDLMSDSDWRLVDETIGATLKSIFCSMSDPTLVDRWVSPVDCWVSFVSFLGKNMDLRRFPSVLSAICDFSIAENNADVDGPRLFLLAMYVDIAGLRFHEREVLLERVSSTISYPDRNVSFQNASILANLVEGYPRQLPSWEGLMADGSFGTLPDQPLEKLERILEQISKFRGEVEENIADLDKVATSNYRWAAEFMLNFLEKIRTPQVRMQIAQRFDSQLTEFFFGLNEVAEVYEEEERVSFFGFLSSLDLELIPSSKLANLLFTCGGGSYPNFESALLEHASKFVSSKVSALPVPVLDALLESSERIMTTSLDDDAAALFALILKNYPVDHVEGVVAKYAAKYTLLVESEGPDSHGAVLGLGSLFDVQAYTVPPPKWLPDAVAVLARFVQSGIDKDDDNGEEDDNGEHDDGEADDGQEDDDGEDDDAEEDDDGQEEAKLILQEFKTSTEYFWNMYRKFFTPEQLECFEKLDLTSLEPEFSDHGSFSGFEGEQEEWE